MPEDLTRLNLDGPALKHELERIQHEGPQIEATVDQDGITAEVSKDVKGWWITAYVKKLWAGPWAGGASIKKEF